MSETISTRGRFVWADLMTTDLDAAKKFYLSLFPGWQIVNENHGPEAPSYDRLTLGGRGIGKLLAHNPEKNTAPRWLAYMTVTDVDGTCAAASAAGGKVLL